MKINSHLKIQIQLQMQFKLFLIKIKKISIKINWIPMIKTNENKIEKIKSKIKMKLNTEEFIASVYSM